MRTARQEFESWIEGYLQMRYPELVPPLLGAIDAFDEIADGAPANEETLAPLLEAARSARVPLYDPATTLLGRLVPRIELVREAVTEMTADARAHVRFNAILCTPESDKPMEFALKLVEGRLEDKSALVREKAADWALRCRMVTLLPALRRALQAESHSRARDCIAYAVRELQANENGSEHAV